MGSEGSEELEKEKEDDREVRSGTGRREGRERKKGDM